MRHMGKYGFIYLLLIAGFILFPVSSYAHTGLVSSEPEAEAVATEPVAELKLSFNTTIEKASRIDLATESGRQVEIKDMSYEKKTMTAILAVPLPNDSYTVNWRIIGEDGHKVTGSYRFRVNVPEKVESASPAPSSPSSGAVASAANDEPKEAASAPPSPAASPEEGSDKSDNDEWMSYAALAAAGGLLIVFIILYTKKNRDKNR